MDFSTQLKLLRKDYLCGKPIKHMDWTILDSISWDQQNDVISATIEAPIVKERGDLSHSYRQQFLRHIIGHLERNALEVHDRIYEHFTQLVNTSGPRGQGYAWKHFELWPTGVEDTVSIRQSETIISDGTTGLHCWQAAGALAEWCLANQSRLHGRSVLELGSGTGLTGLVVAKACAPAKVVLTDGNEKVLALLRENVSENCKNDGQEVVRVAALDWEEVDSSLDELEDIRPEVVIAADVVYDGTLFQPLCSAIDVVFRRSGSNGCSLYLACTMRNEETLEAFLRHLDSLGHERTEERLHSPTVLYWDDSTPIRIFCVTKRTHISVSQ